MQLSFDTKEDAINFANKHGWKYEVKSEHVSRVVPGGTQTYADNFLSKKVRLFMCFNLYLLLEENMLIYVLFIVYCL